MKKSDVWETIGDNLRKYTPSGTYYVQAKLCGRRVRESLGTDNLQTARDRLHKWLDTHRSNGSGAGTGAVMGALVELWKRGLDEDKTITPRTKEYNIEELDFIRRNWPAFEQTKVRKIKRYDVEQWVSRQGCAATRINGALTVLRELFRIAEARGILRGRSPMDGIKNRRVGIKPFSLPTTEQMAAIRASVYHSSAEAGLLFDLLSETGSRISTALAICWEHIDFDRNTIFYEKVKWKENGYRGPISSRLREILEKAKQPTGPLVTIGSCRKPLETACKHLGIKPTISHHDLRHWFITRCIERGIDIPTISRWVGHVDGGALLMKTYGHLRDEHSQAMARLL